MVTAYRCVKMGRSLTRNDFELRVSQYAFAEGDARENHQGEG
ncbi:hypothetical protein NY08_1049 [Rhodococcus sp. B7740]|nr:hypothetical protein NY08_1049 [Rhodococcus sp. B7740]